MKTEDAVRKLCSELRKDEGYYYAWQANIAMAFCDENRRRGSRDSYKLVHEVANQAAKNFLDLLIKPITKEKDKRLPKGKRKMVWLCSVCGIVPVKGLRVPCECPQCGLNEDLVEKVTGDPKKDKILFNKEKRNVHRR